MMAIHHNFFIIILTSCIQYILENLGLACIWHSIYKSSPSLMSSTINVEPRRKLTNGGSTWRRKEKSKLQIYYMTHTHTYEWWNYILTFISWWWFLVFSFHNLLLMRTEWNSNFVVQPLEVKMVMRLLSFKMTMIKLQCANYFTKTFHYPRLRCNSSSRLLNVEHLDEWDRTKYFSF